MQLNTEHKKAAQLIRDRHLSGISVLVETAIDTGELDEAGINEALHSLGYVHALLLWLLLGVSGDRTGGEDCNP